jgi:hypothetical protein
MPDSALDRALFDITSYAEVEAAKRSGAHVPTRFERDGFIHCSYASQVLSVVNFLYAAGRDSCCSRSIAPRCRARSSTRTWTAEAISFRTSTDRCHWTRLSPSTIPCGQDGHFHLPRVRGAGIA